MILNKFPSKKSYNHFCESQMNFKIISSVLTNKINIDFLEMATATAFIKCASEI